MKNIEKYIAGGVAIALFLYLDYLSKDTYASQLFGALMGVFGMIFGLKQGNQKETKKLDEGEIEFENLN